MVDIEIRELRCFYEKYSQHSDWSRRIYEDPKLQYRIAFMQDGDKVWTDWKDVKTVYEEV